MARLCECGCGRETNLAPYTDEAKGWIKGEALRFANGHTSRIMRGAQRWREQDRGYKTPCWIWQSYVNPGGYGIVSVGATTVRAHRKVYEELVGPIAEGLTLDHLCRVRSCVNPAHMEPVTRGENVRRGIAKVSRSEWEEIATSAESPRVLAERFGVSRSRIYGIRREWRSA